MPKRLTGAAAEPAAPNLSRTSVVFGILLWVVACNAGEESPRPAPQPVPGREQSALQKDREPGPEDYVGSDGCAGCHAEQTAAWTGSHHDLAMQPATPETVLGNFDDGRFARFPKLSRFERRGDRFVAHTEGPDGEPADFEVAYTFGVDPLQQYLVEFPGGRLQSLTIAWDPAAGRWFDLYPDQVIAADDALHWTGLYQNSNAMCLECHTTGFRKGFDPATSSYDTTWSEVGVGCEACHGPGSAHVAAASGRGDGAADATHGLPVDLGVGPRTEIEVCAPCHSRRHRVSAAPRVGEPLLDAFMPELLREGLYHPDGQIQGEVYVYGSFVQSRMYARGVRCSDCHDPHRLGLRAEGNALCVRCHGADPDPRFSSLRPAVYDAPSHHFHEPGSTGAECVACHMPAQTFMEVDPRRDHGFRVPRPDLAVALGTPDSCTGCHADRSPAWAAERVSAWYGPERRRGPAFAPAFAAARRGDADAVPELSRLLADADRPPIVRASAVELLGRFGGDALVPVVEATRDESALLRASAAAALDSLPPAARAGTAAPLLRDPRRAVRIEAARVLAPLPPERLDAADRRALRRALAEYVDAQRADADLPAAHMNLAVIQVGRGQSELAEASYRSALSLDPRFLPARVNLAHLYNAQGRNAEALHELRAALALAPDEGELHYSLGLLLAEEKRVDEAQAALAEAAIRLPDRARVRYNLGLLLQLQGRMDEAEQALDQALRLAPDDVSALQALTLLYVERENWAAALPHARRLAELDPGPRSRLLLTRVESERSGAAVGE